MWFIFRAVTKQSDSSFAGKVLQQPEGEFLSMIFDPAISLID